MECENGAKKGSASRKKDQHSLKSMLMLTMEDAVFVEHRDAGTITFTCSTTTGTATSVGRHSRPGAKSWDVRRLGEAAFVQSVESQSRKNKQEVWYRFLRIGY
jgi:hypothetical protein